MMEEEQAEAELSPAERRAASVRRIEGMWFTTRRPVSLELLVSTTVAIRASYDSPSHAADAALRLIDTCARLLEHNQTHAEREKQTEKIREELRLELGAAVQFRDAIKIITGQARAERAEEDFISLLCAEAKTSSPFRISERVAEKFTNFERAGFVMEYLLLARQLFDEYRQAGLLGKKRRPVKKALPRKTTAKLAGTSGKPPRKNGRPPDKAGDPPETQ